MSLNLPPPTRTNRAFNTTAYVPAGNSLAGILATDFDGGTLVDTGSFLLQVDPQNGNVDANTLPTSLLNSGNELFVAGTRLTVSYEGTSGNTITFVDPETGDAYAFADTDSERLSLLMSSTGAWVIAD